MAADVQQGVICGRYQLEGINEYKTTNYHMSYIFLLHHFSNEQLQTVTAHP
jgi:hypothetical protein